MIRYSTQRLRYDWGINFQTCVIDFNPLTPMSDQGRISPYKIKQTSDENKEKYQLGDYMLIQSQILRTNITSTVRQTVRRITI